MCFHLLQPPEAVTLRNSKAQLEGDGQEVGTRNQSAEPEPLEIRDLWNGRHRVIPFMEGTIK